MTERVAIGKVDATVNGEKRPFCHLERSEKSPGSQKGFLIGVLVEMTENDLFQNNQQW